MTLTVEIGDHAWEELDRVSEDSPHHALRQAISNYIMNAKHSEYTPFNFSSMYEAQEQFNKEVDYGFVPESSQLNVTYNNLGTLEQHDVTKHFLLQLHSEVSEALDEIDWKPHTNFNGDVNRDDLVEELVDIQKFLLCILQVWDITPKEFVKTFFDKTEKVRKRHPDARGEEE